MGNKKHKDMQGQCLKWLQHWLLVQRTRWATSQFNNTTAWARVNSI